MKISYLTAETVLVKFNDTVNVRDETTKLPEEIAKRREDLQFSGATTSHDAGII